MEHVAEIIRRHIDKLSTLYSIAHGWITLEYVDNVENRVHAMTTNSLNVEFDEYGRLDPMGQCILYPNEDETWEEFDMRMKSYEGLFKVGDYVKYNGRCWKIKDVGDNSIRLKSITSGSKYYDEVVNCHTKKSDMFEKIDKFDLSTLKPYDKVLVKKIGEPYIWYPDLISYVDIDCNCYVLSTIDTVEVIPFNDDTMHLIGSSNDAEGFYKLG